MDSCGRDYPSVSLARDTALPEDFKYRMRGNVILITYSGAIEKEIVRILQKIEYWHQGSIKAYRILPMR
jgi:hypothetical protein